MKKKVSVLLAAICAVSALALTACGGEPCRSCGKKPAQEFRETLISKAVYLCEDCLSGCKFCGTTEGCGLAYTLVGDMYYVCRDCRIEKGLMN